MSTIVGEIKNRNIWKYPLNKLRRVGRPLYTVIPQVCDIPEKQVEEAAVVPTNQGSNI